MSRRIAVGTVVTLLVIAGLIALRPAAASTRHLTATFARTTSLYEGANVKVLGVKVGTVDSITVKGTAVEVQISYDDDVDLPQNVQALIVPPSIVGDRFVQLAPAYTEGPVLQDNAVLGLDRTGVPLELDDTYKGLDELAAGLGPNGANKDGALSRLIAATAKNLDGNGAEFNAAIREFAGALSTLASSSDDISDTVANLGVTSSTLAGKDAQIRALVSSLARVGAQLNGQRDELTGAVRQLRQALGMVADFTKGSRASVKSSVRGLTDVSDVLVKHLSDLEEMIDLGPVGLTSLVNIYEPKNWKFEQYKEVSAGARTGSLALRNGLLEDLDITLGFALSGFCAAMPPESRAQLAAFCTTLESLGGNLGALLMQASHSGGKGVMDPQPGATTLGGLLTGGER